MSDMYWYYGGYTHAANSVAIRSIQKSYVQSSTGKTHLLRQNWTIEGKLVGDRAMIYADLSLMQSSYSKNDKNFGFSGTPFQVYTSNTIGGVIVTGPVNHEEMKGAHGTTYLKYVISLQADFAACDDGEVLEFQESISFTNQGGGPIYVERQPVQGPPLFQQVTETSWYYATQSGSITTAFINPQPMMPIWPEYVRTAGGGGLNVVYSSPKMQRGIALSYTTTWRYDYASPYPLEQYPNLIT